MIKKTYLAATAAVLCGASLAFASGTQQPVPPGWTSGKITMGTLYDNSPSAQDSLEERPVSVVFTYAGKDGAGDRGTVINPPTKIINTMSQLSLSKKKIMPLFVFYTANASGGGTAAALVDVTNYNYLVDHYENLIVAAQTLQGYAVAKTNPITSTLLLNPDFLGHLDQSNTSPTAALTMTNVPADQMANPLQGALQQALTNLKITDIKIPSTFSGTANLSKYMQSINWLIGTFAPNVDYGWMDNDWAGTSVGNLWIHKGVESSPPPKTGSQEAAWLNSFNVFTPIETINGSTAPSFIAFDKYGANDVVNGDGGNVTRGYLFNENDWARYTAYVEEVGKELNKPVMLFQIPGAHLPTSTDKSEVYNVATGPDYVFGNAQADQAAFNNIPGEITEHTYGFAGTVQQYLTQFPADTTWSTSHLQDLVNNHVFAVLWGGGGFATGVIPQGGNLFNDNGWLYGKIKTSYSTGLVAQPQNKPAPNPDDLPVYPAGGPFKTGSEVVLKKGQWPVYQCGQYPGWCNAGGAYAPGTGSAWQQAWTQINKPAAGS